MNPNYSITRMSRQEVNTAINWAAKAGWNPGLHDAECFYQTDPQGFFSGKIDNKIISVGSAVIYDDYFAFCGFYIVDEAYRGQGYGLKLTQERLKYIGNRNAGIDGVMDMLSKYERIGYKLAHNNARYSTTWHQLNNKPSTNLVPTANIPKETLNQYDRRHFPAARTQFLSLWIAQPGVKSIAYMQNNTLSGYGVIRPCREGFKIGPLFADTPDIADALFVALANHSNEEPIYLDIPENNPYAIALVNRYKLDKIFETARMYLKKPPDLPITNIYGITSFELG